MKYTEKVMSIVNDTLSRVDRIKGQIENLKMKLKDEDISPKSYQEQSEDLKKQMESVRLEAATNLQAVGKAYNDAVVHGIEIDSTMLHDDAKLFQLDMKMTAHQFEVLVEKHKDNPLMMQLMQEYSNKHAGLYACFIPTADVKVKSFDDFIGCAMDTIRTPDSIKAGFFLDGKCTPEYCNEME